MNDIDGETLKEYWETDIIGDDRLSQWCQMIASAASTDPNIDYSLAWKVLCGIFTELEPGGKNISYVHDANDSLTLKIAESTPYEIFGPEIIESSFTSAKIGDRVFHRSYGEGIVKRINDGMIIVSFNGTDKRFQYPQAFQNQVLKKSE